MLNSYPLFVRQVSLYLNTDDDENIDNFCEIQYNSQAQDVTDNNIYMMSDCTSATVVEDRNDIECVTILPVHNLLMKIGEREDKDNSNMTTVIKDETSACENNPKQLKHHNVRLILPGSGVRGAFQAGFVEALHESGHITVDRVYGTSVGSIIAPYAASGRTQELRHVISGIRTIKSIFKPWPMALTGWIQKCFAVFGSGAFKELKLLKQVDRDFPDPDDPVLQRCECVAWDVYNRKNVWFTGRNYLKGMKASCALVGVLPPVQHTYPSTCSLTHTQTLLIDSKITELVPLDNIPNNYNGTYVLVFPCPTIPSLPSKQEASGTGTFDMLHSVVDSASSQLLECDLQAIQNRIGKNRLVVVEPPQDYFKSYLDVDTGKIKAAYEAGKKAFWNSNIVQV